MTDPQPHTDDALEAALDALDHTYGWYVLPDGTKVQGRDAARAALAGTAGAEGENTRQAVESPHAAPQPRSRGYIGRAPSRDGARQLP